MESCAQKANLTTIFDFSTPHRNAIQPKGKSMRNLRSHLPIAAVLVFCSASWLDAQILTLPGPAAINSVRPGAPIGEGIFTNLPFKASLSADAGYDDNVFSSHSDRIGSGYNDLSLDIGSHIGNERGRLDGDIALGFLYYWYVPGTSLYPNISLNFNSSYKLTPRLVLSLSSNLVYESQPNFSIAGAATQFVGNYFIGSSQISLGYEWTPRISSVTSYNLTTYLYENSTEAAQQNRFEHLIGEQLRYMLLPTVTLLTEYRFGYISYETPSNSNQATNNDSYSQFLLAGTDATLSPRLSITFRGGAELRTFLTTIEMQKTFPYAESTLSYEYLRSCFLQWYNRLGLEQSDFATGKYKEVYRTGIRVDHTFGQKMKANASIYYSYNQYKQPFSLTENDLDVNTTVSYAIYRSLSVQAGYTLTCVFSKIASQDYYKNKIFLGASFAF
jgi:Putative beta-barrel porin 2